MITAAARFQQRPSELQRALELMRDPKLLSLALGLPAQEFFPAAELGDAAAAVLAEDPAVLQYAAPQLQLKSHIVNLMARRGVRCTEEEVFLTTGAQQGLALTGQLLLCNSSAVMTAEAVYPGFRQALGPTCPRLLALPLDPLHGFDVDRAEAVLRRGPRPAFLYTMSVGHNPLSGDLDRKTQEQVIEFSTRHQLPIVEDDVYGFLQYEAGLTPSLRSLAQERIFYVGSFSKLLAPALRVGWLVAPAECMEALGTLKEGLDINSTTLAQLIILRYLQTHEISKQIAMLRREYRVRRDAMQEALSRHLGKIAKWKRPTSGFFFWVECERFGNTVALLERAVLEKRVSFVPGAAFQVDGGLDCHHAMRLNFSHPSPTEIEEGISRIAAVA